MARRKSGGGMALGIVALVAFCSLASIPKDIWVGIGVIAALGFIGYVLFRIGKSGNTSTPEATLSITPLLASGDSICVHEPESGIRPSGYRIPTAPNKYSAGKWIPASHSVEVAGVRIPGGMIYVGYSLRAASGADEPCLIDPDKSVAARSDFTVKQTPYWPSYSQITPSARRAYLNWLADGRRNPNADIGYVFLFFYGLERRAIVDASNDKTAELDLPAIAKEIRELLEVYGPTSRSFRNYASNLLNIIEFANYPSKLYAEPIPLFTRGYELPLHLRIALGQVATDGVAVAPRLALAWARGAPEIGFRTPATRCAEEFDKLFVERYLQTYGNGFMLPKNKTKLKLVYNPASAGLWGTPEVEITFGDVPDVTVLTGPQKKLQSLVDAVCKELDAYSRLVGKNPDLRASLEGLLQLPVSLWPEGVQKAFQELKARMGSGTVMLSFQELLSSLGATAFPTKEKVLSLVRALESLNIGMEPDVLFGAKSPKPEEKVVLFAIDQGASSYRKTPEYQAALLTIEISCAVSYANGQVPEAKLSYLRSQIGLWTHLEPEGLRRLSAYLRILADKPVSLAVCKRKLEPLAPSAKETIATFVAKLVGSDGAVSRDEIQMLEKVYNILGIEQKQVFSDVHSAAAGISPVSREDAEQTAFTLDTARIAALQKDSERVSTLLSNIFKEDHTLGPASVAETEPEEAVVETGLLGLDDSHTAFVRVLLSRPQWSREDLLNAASELDLMLDGALEQINEASFEYLDIALTEYDDPIKINREALEKIET
ncbi:TerB N-terminal domain-containing protein [Acidithiobacillus thiooxidans]|uniref:tellurite resistance TerB family protein n=1 Tax=Acidithiobacillus thiooxidans TaxID=930 RepID=UPI00286197EB|nr:TerB N-terminal domain-containing protein [Acidithiobacillus thiooxidans]MDR7927039.1 TerB N-terminal domain-containing protein [Acidithiobacillus thiooxidans]